MSSYYQITKHPITGKYEQAAWLDNHFEHYRYAVKFADGMIFDEREYRWEFADRPDEPVADFMGWEKAQQLDR